MVEARVEYDYDAENMDELTLRSGEIITHVVQKEGGWWEGKLNGKHGVFPDNFVKVLNIKEKSTTSDGKTNGISLRKDKKRKCRVVYSYTPVNEDELELEVDNTIEVIEEVEEGWWKGVLNGRVGVFPSNFVEEVNERTASVPTTKTSKDGSEEIKPKPIRGVGLGNIFQDEIIRLKPTQDSPPDRKMSTSPIQKKQSTIIYSCEAPTLPPKPVKELAKVLYAYDACNDDELSLKEGDVIAILTKDVEDKGWWKGELNNKIGVFPDNFVELLPSIDVKCNKKLDTGGERVSDAPPPVPEHPKKAAECSKDEKPLRPEKRVPPLPGKKPQLPPPLKKPQRGITPINETQSSSPLLSSTTTTTTSTSSSSSIIKTDPMTDDMKVKSQTGVTETIRPSSDELGLDSVELTSDKLTHLTASRPRNPHHRPPSHLFLKDPPAMSKEKLSDVIETETKEEVDSLPLLNNLHQTAVRNGRDVCCEAHEKGKFEIAPSPTKETDKLCPSPQPICQIDKNILWPPIKPCLDSELSSPKMKQYSFSSKSTPVPKDEVSYSVSSKSSKSTDDESLNMISDMKKEMNCLKTKVLELQLMTEMHRAQYQEKVKELTHEIDEEKKTRMMMQVELDRLKRQLRDH